MKKILIVFGTRPEAIKMAPLIKEFLKYPEFFELKVCVTGQHRQMVDDVLDFFGIVPDFDLHVMRPNQDLFDVTAAILSKIKSVLQSLKPDIVFVHGDTTTTFTAALGCYYQKIDVAHVEAGLRTFKKYSPFPEEIYRELICKITKYHFPPTDQAKANLLRDNIGENLIVVTGNTVIDSLFLTLEKIKEDRSIEQKLLGFFPQGFSLEQSKFVLITAHRRENFGEGLEHIIQAIQNLAKDYPKIDFVYPVHLNPNINEPVHQMLSSIENVYLIKPLEYELFIYLLNQSYMILTDSGGVQEEAPALGKPVLVMRDTTERREAVEAGTVKLVGTDTDSIYKETSGLLDDPEAYRKMSVAQNPYGDGQASRRIVESFRKSFI
jgi:UDP-N-acetylglucosamine 2-epimerase (non-hydrolysing)